MKSTKPTRREEAIGYVLSFGLATILFAFSMITWWQVSMLDAEYTQAATESRMKYSGLVASMVTCSIWAYCYSVAIKSSHWLAVAKESWYFLTPALTLLISTAIATRLIQQCC
jgi:hypothetical protein